MKNSDWEDALKAFVTMALSSLIWPLVLVVGTPIGLFFGLVHLFAQGYRVSWDRKRRRQAELRKQADQWSALARDPAQIEATRDAARAAAQAFREQADAVQVPVVKRGRH